MRTLFLDVPKYWNQIEDNTSLTTGVRDTLKCAVNAHINTTIPSSISDRNLKDLITSQITNITLTDNKGGGGIEQEQLSIMLYNPANHETHRRFIYLAKQYPNGENISIENFAKK